MVKKAFHAIYENGVLRPLAPLSLQEGETVLVSFQERTKSNDLLSLAQGVYEGLSEQEVEDIENITLNRHFERIEELILDSWNAE